MADPDNDLPVPVLQPERTPTPVLGLPSVQPDAGVSVTRLHVPISVVVGIFSVVVGGLVSMTMVWARTVDHGNDHAMHLDAQESMRGGGPAFKLEVATVKAECDKKLQTEHQRMRRLLKAMTFRCETRGQGMDCHVDLPESAE